jgi:hypothetical protein
LKNPSQKRAGGVAQGVSPGFKTLVQGGKKENIHKPPLVLVFEHILMEVSMRSHSEDAR